MSLHSTDYNPGYLKLELAAKGMRLDDTLRERMAASSAAADEPRRSLELVLPDGVRVDAPVEEMGDTSPFVLSGQGDHVTLRRNGSAVDVRLVPEPRFYQLNTTSGRAMHQVGQVYGSFIAINPGVACGFSLRGAPCRFCRNGSGVPIGDAFPMSEQDVVQTVRAAFSEGTADFVYFNLPYVGSEDAGIAFLEPYIRAVKRQFNTLVAVQLHPPKGNRWIDRTYAMGVDAVSYAIEIYDPDLLARRCTGRTRFIGRERYYDALQYAATIFPRGTVWSDLIVGLESTESTMRGIDKLAAMGVLPVLSVHRPAAGDAPLRTVEEIAPVYAHLFHAVRDSKITMSWLRDLTFAVTPLEARFFAGDAARRTVAMQQFYRSRIGTVAARNLARLRRQLRVREVGDSFDASHL